MSKQKTICKNLAFSKDGKCLMGDECTCEVNKKWLDESIQDAPSTKDGMLEKFKEARKALIHCQSSMALKIIDDIIIELEIHAAQSAESPAPGEVPEMPMDLKKWMKEQEHSLSNEDAFGYRLGAVAIYKKLQPEITQLLADKEALRLECNEIKQKWEDYQRDVEEVLQDQRRLTKEIGDILDGEGAARQPSLVDLVGPIKELKDQLAEAQNDRDVYKQWFARAEANVKALTEQLGAVQRERDDYRTALETVKRIGSWVDSKRKIIRENYGEIAHEILNKYSKQ